MNIGLKMNIGQMISRIASGSDQAKVNHQAALMGSDGARDKLVKDKGRERMAQAVGGKRAQVKVLDLAGVTKPAAAKKR